MTKVAKVSDGLVFSLRLFAEFSPIFDCSQMPALVGAVIKSQQLNQATNRPPHLVPSFAVVRFCTNSRNK